MFIQQLLDRVDAEPFEPFRIWLVNGQMHDVFHTWAVVVSSDYVSIYPPDQNWFVVPIDKIASLESLFADYHGMRIELGAE